MLKGVNIEEVKQYNSSLKQYKDQSARLRVEIEVNTKELTQLCNQLSAELGVEVTTENVEQIYKEQVEKINNILETGNTILHKIESESNSGQSMGLKQGSMGMTPPVAPAQPFNQPMTGGGLFGGPSQASNVTELPQPGTINGVTTKPLFNL